MKPLTLILLFTLLFLVVTGLILFYFLFKRAIKLRYYRWKYKETFIRAIIIFSNNQAKEVFTSIGKDLRVKDGKEAYIIVAKEVVYFGRIPTLFYMHGNPNPLSFREVRDLNVKLNTENFDLAMTQKIIKDILSENVNLKIIMILLGVVGAMVLVILLRVMKLIKLKGE